MTFETYDKKAPTVVAIQFTGDEAAAEILEWASSKGYGYSRTQSVRPAKDGIPATTEDKIMITGANALGISFLLNEWLIIDPDRGVTFLPDEDFQENYTSRSETDPEPEV